MSDAAQPSARPESGAWGACALCGETRAGAYCHHCGQPGPGARRTLSEALTGQTGRLARTLRLLVFRPGEFAREVAEYRDRLSVRPLTLLLNVIAVFFVLSALTDFRFQSFEASDGTGQFARAVERHTAATAVSREVFTERAERRFQSAYTVLYVAALGIYASLMWLTHRRGGLPWLVHLAAAVAYLCVSFLATGVVFMISSRIGIGALSFASQATQGAIAFVYLVLMLRRAYDDSIGRALRNAVLILGAGIVVDAAIFVGALNLALWSA